MHIARAFAEDRLAGDVATDLNRSPTWLSLFLKEHAPELLGKNTERRKNAAIDWVERANRNGARAKELFDQVKAMNVDNDLIYMEGMTLDIAKCLGEADIATLDDLAGLIPDDLIGFTEIMPDGELIHERGIVEDLGISEALATALIMRARVLEGWIEAPAPSHKQVIQLNTSCLGFSPNGQVCGKSIRKGRTRCRECWIRSIPDSYAAIMTPQEFENYLGTYEDE